jgi:hypothetical protein
MSLTLLQEFTRRTGIRDGKVDAILMGQAALPKFRHGIELPRPSIYDSMTTTIAPPQPPAINPIRYMERFLPNKWQGRYWRYFLGIDYGKGHSVSVRRQPSDDAIRRMIDELIEGHHTGDMPHEQG